MEQHLATWRIKGLPGRWELLEIGNELSGWCADNNFSGLWDIPPLMVGATLDDAWGMGLELILKFAKVLGMETRLLGLFLSWTEVADQCRQLRPDFLGMTVLQFDTEDDLIALRQHLPEKTRLIVGGPIFRTDTGIQDRASIDYICQDLPDFIQLMLRLSTT